MCLKHVFHFLWIFIPQWESWITGNSILVSEEPLYHSSWWPYVFTFQPIVCMFPCQLLSTAYVMTAICQVAVTSHYGETHPLKTLISSLTSTAYTTNSKPHRNLHENNTFFFSPGDATAAEYYNQNDDQDQDQGKGHCHQYNGPGRQR